MKRKTRLPRANWQEKVEALGLIWHSAGGEPYWDESAYYSFTAAQIDEIQSASETLYALFIEAGQSVIDRNLFSHFGIADAWVPAIIAAWDGEPPALNYGRFDLGYDGKSPPKLFEFNCDTPTSLLEAAVVQWQWKEDVFPAKDQCNGVHDALVARWAEISPRVDGLSYFTHAADDVGEDMITVSYMRDVAVEAGLDTIPILINDIGWHDKLNRFVDLNDQPIEALFHLYPWEWLVAEEFGQQVVASTSNTAWIEPIWKMIWSNKAILAVLWELFPNHPNLLPASIFPLDGDHVRKPLLAREGANVSIVKGGEIRAETSGHYGSEGYVHQALYDLPGDGQNRPVIGSWMVDGASVGMGIREDGLITGNTARFIPHIIEG
jgi:glutathionylspermidine synthase